MNNLPLSGARILHVEDEVLIALEVESICLEGGAVEVIHISDLEGMKLPDAAAIDVAVVDLSIRGQSTLPLAATLHQSGVPLVFMSGLERMDIAGQFPMAQFVAKPFKAAEVTAAIAAALSAKVGASGGI